MFNSMTFLTNGNVGIATTTPPGYPLTVNGVIYSVTGGVKYPDGNTQTVAYLGSSQTVTAGNVSSGAFGFPSASNAYAFPAALAIGTSTTTGLPANGLFVLSNVGIGTTTPVCSNYKWLEMKLGCKIITLFFHSTMQMALATVISKIYLRVICTFTGTKH